MDNGAAAIRQSIRPERRLRVSKVSDVTLLRYHSHVLDFLHWVNLRKRKLVSTERQVDIAMSTYFNEQFEDDRSFSLGSYTLYGWIALKMVPTVPERDLLPLSRAALAAWKSQRPGNTRVGVPPQVIFAFAKFCVQRGCIHAAVAALLQYDLYARPSEILQISSLDLVFPVRGMSGHWGVIFGNSDRGERTKTGAIDDIVLADSMHRSWCNKLLQHVGTRARHHSCHIFNITLGQYEGWFRRFCLHFQLEAGAFSPHTVRHSGPSFDAIHRHRTLPEIQQRGRWESASSVARYKKPGRLLLQASRLPVALREYDANVLQSALSTIMSQSWVLGAPLTLP